MIGQQKISSFFKSIPAKTKVLCSANGTVQHSANLSADKADDKESEGNSMMTKTKQKRPASSSDSPRKNEKRSKTHPTDDQCEKEIPTKRQCLNTNSTTSTELTERMAQAKTDSNNVVTHVGSSWFQALQPEFSKDYFNKLCTFVNKERESYTVYPPSHQVFAWTQMCDVQDVKVVILGQDPYHGPRQAHGLCFSVQSGVTPPPSLVNMYKLLEKDIEGFKRPSHGNLTGWARQGVLLLNACLTVRASQANSHKDKGWEKFTDAVIKWLNNNLEGVVFLLWGAYAQKKGACIDKKRHRILKGVHPSPLSAHRGFFDCNHFSKTNMLLKEQGKDTIDWTHLPEN